MKQPTRNSKRGLMCMLIMLPTQRIRRCRRACHEGNDTAYHHNSMFTGLAALPP